MSTQTAARKADSSPMGDEQRGAAIKRRRLALGIDGYRQFAEATGRDRETLTRAEQGNASKSTYDWIEAWLDRIETETGMNDPSPADPIRVEMHGVYGIQEVIVTGPVDHPDELAEAVGKILDRIRQGDRP
jgi:transcriptional regulator with XRE-family HTH domain